VAQTPARSGVPVRPGVRAWLRTGPYLAAFGAVAVALALRYALRANLGQGVPYLLFYPAVTVVAWLGGLGPGLVATGLSSAAAMFLFLPPDGFAVDAPADRVSLAVFVASGCLIAALSQRLHRVRNAHEEAARIASVRAERLDAILNTTLDGIIVIDDKGTIEAFNPGAERLFGYSETDVVGRNVSLLMPSPHQENHDGYLQRYLATGEARIIGVGREVVGRRRDGTAVPVHLSVGEMRIGGARKFTGLLHDLSKRAGLSSQLQASEARWRAVIDSAVDGIVVIDTHGHIESFNRAAERLFGYTELEALGRNVSMLMPSPYREEHDAYIARYLAAGAAKIIGIGREVQALRKDGSTFPVHLSVAEMTVADERKFTGIIHDLSDRVRMEETLRERAALARLGEMAAVLAHEVKNPLAGIRGAIQVVGSRLPPDTPGAPILKEILTRIDSLDEMMKDLLMFARPPKPRLQPTAITPLVRATADLLGQDPTFGDIKFDITGSAPPVAADADMLKIVFQNLLINGAQAMQGRGRIRVDVTSTDGACSIAFSDNGPGIPADVRHKVFEPFFTTKSRGNGLGLPTVKRLVEAHGGDVAIGFPPGGGTAVVVRLPLQPPGPAAATSGPAGA
jgi:two-component system, LuxR family, sensor kinase FixL